MHASLMTVRCAALTVVAWLLLVTPPLAAAATAVFVSQDDQTKGDWERAYGADGAWVAGDVARLPTWATFKEAGEQFLYEADSQDARAPWQVEENARLASSRYAPTFACELTVSGPAKRVAIYVVDFNRKGRSQKLEVLDAASGKVLDTRAISAFAEGRHYVYDISGAVRLQFTGDGTNPALVNAVFFGAAARPGGGARPVKPPPPPPTTSGFHKQRFTATVGTATVTLPFLLWLPETYVSAAQERFPVVVFLHGIGECGRDLGGVYIHGPAKMVQQNAEFRQKTHFIGLYPQCPGGWDQPNIAKAVVQIVDHVLKQWRADPDRVAVTGLSNGGKGTWIIGQEGGDERFSVIVPMDAFAFEPATAVTRLGKAHTWIIVGDSDGDHTSGSKQMHAALTQAKADAHLTVVPNCGHGAWDRFYYDPTLYEWMFKHRRGGPPLPLPLPASGIIKPAAK